MTTSKIVRSVAWPGRKEMGEFLTQEWLVTNGLGGYASGTLAGALTRRFHGLLIASPGYHGGVSGMIKNALDYAEDLRHDDRPYLEDRAVGCIAVAHGWQTAVGTLHQLRQTVHALRGWPAPLGCAINDSAGLLGEDAASSDPAVVRQLVVVGRQVTGFAHAQQALRRG